MKKALLYLLIDQTKSILLHIPKTFKLSPKQHAKKF